MAPPRRAKNEVPTKAAWSTTTSLATRPNQKWRQRTLSVLVLAGIAVIAIAPESSAYTYKIKTRGTITADVGAFARTVAATYADRRGWTRAGVTFHRLPAAAKSDFTVVLAAANTMTSFSSLCSRRYSCRVGRYVILNEERWRYGVPHWTGTLLAYRRMVVNHETGHWLGLAHHYCPHDAAVAPVMQQQSISLQGCRPNPWPRGTEIRAVTFASVLGGFGWVWSE